VGCVYVDESNTAPGAVCASLGMRQLPRPDMFAEPAKLMNRRWHGIRANGTRPHHQEGQPTGNQNDVLMTK
jgi:hypothetical protein